MAKTKDTIDGDDVLRLTSLDIENVLRLRAVHLTLERDGALIVEAQNEQGKTSLIKATNMLFGGGKALPEDPIHGDEPSGHVTAMLGDIKIERLFRRNKPSQLKITSPGSRYKTPQSILSSMINTIALDPLAFFADSDEQRAKTIVEMQGIDLSQLEQKRSDAFDDRRDQNRETKKLQAVVDTLKENPDLDRDDVGEEEVSVGDLVAKLKAAQEHNKVGDDIDESITSLQEKLPALEQAVDKARDALEEAESALELNCKQIVELQGKLNSFIPEDEDDIQEQIGNIEETNKIARAKQKYNDAYAEWEAAQQKADELDETLREIDKEIESARAEAAERLPVPGLSIADGRVMYNGKPLSQAGDSAELRISTAIAIALNKDKRIKLMCIDKAEQLDKKNTRLLLQMAKDAGFQVIMTRVGDGKEASVVIEDGVVAE
jgi:hypothetical protein